MSRRPPMRQDSSLVRSHEAGSTAEVLQVLEHEHLGVIGYVWPRFWTYHFAAACSRRDALADLHERVATLMPDHSDVRLLADHLLLSQVFETVAEMVIHAVLTVRHFTLEVERVMGVRSPATNDLTRLRDGVSAAGLSDPTTMPGWDCLAELVQRRHAIEHPTPDTVYSCHEWDHVPLAWGLTTRPLDVAAAFQQVFDRLGREWDHYLGADRSPGTITVRERGLRAKRSAKKST